MNFPYLLNNQKNLSKIMIVSLTLVILFFIYFNYSIYNSYNYYYYDYNKHYKCFEGFESAIISLPPNIFNEYKLSQEAELHNNSYNTDKDEIFQRIQNKKNTEISLHDYFIEFKSLILSLNQSRYQYGIYVISQFLLGYHDETMNNEITIDKNNIHTLYKHLYQFFFPDTTFLQHNNRVKRIIEHIINIYISLKIYNKLHNDTFFDTLDNIHKDFEAIDTHPMIDKVNIIAKPLQLVENYGYSNDILPRSVALLSDLIIRQQKIIDDIVNSKGNEEVTFENFCNTSNIGNHYLYLLVLKLELFYSKSQVKNFTEFYNTITNNSKIYNKNMYRYLLYDLDQKNFTNKTYKNNHETFFQDRPSFSDIIIFYYWFLRQIYPIKFLDAFNEFENL